MKKWIVSFICFFIFNGYWRGRYRDFLMEINPVEDIIGLLNFQRSSVAPGTVLLIEPNNTHGEVLPGFSQYWLDLGYQVDVLIPSEATKENPFCRFPIERLRLYKHSCLTIGSIMRSAKLKNYDVLFVTTTAYYHQGGVDRKHVSFYDYITKRNYGNTLLLVEHDLSDIVRFQEEPFLHANKLFTLFKLAYAGYTTRMVNPHYFGRVAITQKNTGHVQFIVIGKVEEKRRNYALLVRAVNGLLGQGITNFTINIVGQGSPQAMPAEMQPFFVIKGRLDFPDMFSCLEEADFLLPLLDADQDEHKRYLTTGVTGSLQLILGFQKPGLLQNEFARFYGFSEEDSIPYQGDSLAHAMGKAIRLPPEDYTRMQAGIKEKAERIYRESQKNLRDSVVNLRSVAGME